MDPERSGFAWKQTSAIAGYWSLFVGENVEICLEPQVFGPWLLAVYVDEELVQENKLELNNCIIPPGGVLLQN